MKKYIAWPISVLILLTLMIFASPYWTLYQIKHAYDANDLPTVMQYVDFPRVRENVKTQLNQTLTQKAEYITQSPLLQALNIKIDTHQIINRMVEQSVESTITPEGVTTLLINRGLTDPNTQLFIALTAVAMDKLDLTELITARNGSKLKQLLTRQLAVPPTASATQQITAGYCGVNCFEVSGSVRGYPLTIDLERRGLLHWQVVAVALPVKQAS